MPQNQRSVTGEGFYYPLKCRFLHFSDRLLKAVPACPAHQLGGWRRLGSDYGDNARVVVHGQMKGQRFQDMFILSKTLGAWRVEILPRFKLVDDHQQPVKTLITRELTIDMEEPATDVFRKWDGNVDSLSRFDNGFGKCLWSPFLKQIIGGWPSLIVALNIVGNIALYALWRLLPPGVDFVASTYRNLLMETYSG